MVAEEQSSPMPKHDPWIEEGQGDEEGGWPKEFVDSDHNEPGSQAPPSGEALPEGADEG
jgi:hypothetical protein